MRMEKQHFCSALKCVRVLIKQFDLRALPSFDGILAAPQVDMIDKGGKGVKLVYVILSASLTQPPPIGLRNPVSSL